MFFSHRNDLELKVEGCESVFIEVKSQLKKPCIIGVICRHPSKKIQNFQTELSNLLIKLQKNYDYVIGGDLSLDLIKYNSSNAITDCINCLLSCGCVSLINKPTRISANCVLSLLDHIYTNIIAEQKIHDVGIALFGISDHLPVFINFSFTFTAYTNNRPKIRCLKNFNLEQFLLDQEENITKLPSDNEDINHTCEEFVKTFNTTLDHHAP